MTLHHGAQRAEGLWQAVKLSHVQRGDSPRGDSMNVVCISGKLAADPQLVSDTATPCCLARVVLEETGKERRRYTMRVDVEAWGQGAVTLQMARKGTPIVVSGRLRWRNRADSPGTAQSGLVVSSTYIELLSPEPDRQLELLSSATQRAHHETSRGPYTNTPTERKRHAPSPNAVLRPTSGTLGYR